MLKALFFGAASVSSCNTVYPILDELSSQYQLIAYNCEGFSPPLHHRYTFKTYPPYEGGYHPTCMDENTSYLQFGEILIDTAASLSGYVVSEIEREKPDFILYSHLAVWGRLAANHFDIPAISMFNTFVMDKRVMLSYFRKKPKNVGGTDHLKDTIRFSRKLARLHDELKVRTEPDIWDIYINPGGPNLSCIFENFQPDRQVLGPECKFIGFPGEINGEYPNRDIIYVAMGTILNRNEEFYKLCIRALGQLDQHCVLVVGRSTNIASLGDVPGNIQIVPFADQVNTLKRSMVFLTRGGMASVHEALYAKTPMIVIPEMAEQQMNAETIESMGVGLHLPAPDVSEESILQSINHILKNHSTYTSNIRALIAAAPQRSPGEIAAESIISYIGN